MPPNDQKPRHETVMDVVGEEIARVYAQAFMAVAAKTPDVAGLIAQLESFVVDVLDRFPEFDRILVSALIPHEEKERIIDRVTQGRAAVQVVNFLKVLSARGRLDCLRAVVRALHKLYEEQCGRVDVELRLARKIDDPLLKEVTAALRQSLGKEPVVKLVVDPSLVAGFIVRVGDTMYDGSVKTRFEKARHAMIERAVETIETQPEKFLEEANY